MRYVGGKPKGACLPYWPPLRAARHGTRCVEAAVAKWTAIQFIRPGSDVFLLAAMAHTLFDEGLVRLGRLQPHVAGLDALRDALQAFSPEAVAARCAIASDVIRSLVRGLATSSADCVYARIGSCSQTFGTLASWLVDVLNVLTGHLDAPGGAMFPRAAAFAYTTQGCAGAGAAWPRAGTTAA